MALRRIRLARVWLSAETESSSARPMTMTPDSLIPGLRTCFFAIAAIGLSKQSSPHKMGLRRTCLGRAWRSAVSESLLVRMVMTTLGSAQDPRMSSSALSGLDCGLSRPNSKRRTEFPVIFLVTALPSTALRSRSVRIEKGITRARSMFMETVAAFGQSRQSSTRPPLR